MVLQQVQNLQSLPWQTQPEAGRGRFFGNPSWEDHRPWEVEFSPYPVIEITLITEIHEYKSSRMLTNKSLSNKCFFKYKPVYIQTVLLLLLVFIIKDYAISLVTRTFCRIFQGRGGVPKPVVYYLLSLTTCLKQDLSYVTCATVMTLPWWSWRLLLLLLTPSHLHVFLRMVTSCPMMLLAMSLAGDAWRVSYIRKFNKHVEFSLHTLH